jgi:hypothetical protein
VPVIETEGDSTACRFTAEMLCHPLQDRDVAMGGVLANAILGHRFPDII